jgi:cell division protein FtsB
LKKKRGPQFPLTQFIAIVVITISLFLVVDFARRTAATYKIRAEATRLEEEVTAARTRHQALQARLSYVQSDAYVEEIARTQLKWTREGETAVVVMATPQPETSPPPESQSESAKSFVPQSPWHAWWFLFFDGPPPT